jgi:hypothetical protein
MDIVHAPDMIDIEPTRTYSLQDIKILELFPWAKDNRTIRKILEEKKYFGASTLKPKIVGSSNRRRYSVKGSNIINYIKIYGPWLITTVRKTKQYDNRKNRKSKAQ